MADPVSLFIITTVAQIGISYLFPAEGPRLRDLRVSASTYGAVIPETFGKMRSATNMIWSSKIREKKTKKSGKGGGYYNEYTYFEDFAMGICKGPIDGVYRVWADGKLVYSNPNGTSNAVSKAGSVAERFLLAVTKKGCQARLYVGDEDQLPDPLIEAAKGVGNTPAYRGLAYIVFENFPLSDFGNRVPQITVEVYTGATTTQYVVTHMRGEHVDPFAYGPFLSTGIFHGFGLIDWQRGLFYADAFNNGVIYTTPYTAGNQWGIATYDLDTGARTRYVTGPDIGILTQAEINALEYPGQDWGAHFLFAITADGHLLVMYRWGDLEWTGFDWVAVSSPGCKLFKVNPDTMQVVASAGGRMTVAEYAAASPIDFTFGGPIINPNNLYYPPMGLSTIGGEYIFFFGDDNLGGRVLIYIINTNTMHIDAIGPLPAAYVGVGISIAACAREPINIFAIFYVGFRNFITGGIDLVRIDIAVGVSQVAQIQAPVGGKIWVARSIIYDASDPGFIITYTDAAPSIPSDYMVKYSEDTQTVIWSIDITNDIPHTSTTNPKNRVGYISPYSKIYDNRFAFLVYSESNVNGIFNSRVCTIDSRTGEFLSITKQEVCKNFFLDDGADQINTPAVTLLDGTGQALLAAAADDCENFLWDSTQGLLVTGMQNNQDTVYPATHFYKYQVSPNHDMNLGFIVERILRKGGLQGTEFDLTPLYNIIVNGYGWASLSDIQAILAELKRIYLFDLVESEGQLKAVMRGSDTSLFTIPYTALGSSSEEATDFWKETRIQEADIPELIQLVYFNLDQDYNNTTATSKRIQNPVPTMFSRQKVQIQANLALHAPDAKVQVNKMLYTQWLERTKHTSRLPWAFLDADPTDVFTTTLKDGRSYFERMHEIQLGADLAIAMTSYGQDSGAYITDISNINVDAGGIPGQTTIPRVKPIVPIILNTPLLRDVDDGGGSASIYYAGMSVASPGDFGTGTLFRSTNGIDYENILSEADGVIYGYVSGAPLGSPTRGTWAMDDGNQLKIYPIPNNFDLSSITRDQLYSGENFAVVGKEVIQFQNAVQNVDGTWTISNFLRARRGTDYAVDNHGGGERFVLLDTTSLDILTDTIDAAGLIRYFKAMAPNSSNPAIPETITYYPRDLMPYSVADIRRHIENDTAGHQDIVISWSRRTRFGGGLKDGTGDVPLNEASEAYETYILPTAWAGDASTGAAPGTFTRLITSSTPYVTYTAAQQTTDGFDATTDTLHLVIFQKSDAVGRGFASPRSIPFDKDY